jgi:hypothetical protein
MGNLPIPEKIEKKVLYKKVKKKNNDILRRQSEIPIADGAASLFQSSFQVPNEPDSA